MHRRPLRAAMDLIGLKSIIDLLAHPETEKIMMAYGKLVPEVNETWPGAGIGLAASVDRVRKLLLPVNFSRKRIEPWEGMGFKSREKWLEWCRHDPDIAAEASFAFADLHDFAGGLNEIEHGNAAAVTLWEMARSNLEDVANTLPTTFSVDSVIQPICMVAELSVKAALVWDGADPKSLKGKDGHNLKLLAERMAHVRPHRDDPLVAEVVAKLPPYVDSRYRPAGLTRLEVVRFALGAQFIAASSLRRIATADLAAQMETGGWPAPRRPLFPDAPLRGL